MIQWAIFDRLRAHLVKPSSITGDGHRREGITHCGRRTSTNIDIWQESSSSDRQCKICRRAYLKSIGVQVPSRYKRSERA